MLTDQEIRIKALDAAVRLRAAIIGKQMAAVQERAKTLEDAKEFEKYIRNGQR